MPTEEKKLSEQERIAKEQQERKAIIVKACADVSQANIDLMCVVIEGDTEKRSATFWLETSFNYAYKYQKRLREYAAERKAAVDRKENEQLFNKYIKMTPPKNPAEYLTLLQRFGLIDATPAFVEAPAPATATATKVA